MFDDMRRLGITAKALLRDALLLTMICGALFFYALPIPSIVWRGCFILLCVVCAVGRGLTQRWSSLEIVLLFFLGLNLVYFGIAASGIYAPSVSAMGSIAMALMSLSAFAYLSAQGQCSDKVITVSFVGLLVASIGYFYYMRDNVRLEYVLDEDEGITNNASVAFLALLPWLFLIRKRWVSLLGFFVCLFFIVLGAKRGNILAAVIPSILFVVYMMRSMQGGGRKLLCILAVITVIGSGVWTFLQEDEYLQQRIEDTMEGNSSGRDTIYREALECWYYAGETQFWIGHGFLSTIPEIGKMAHNDWLEILVDYGVLGFVIYALLFYQLIKVIKRESDARYRMVMLSCLSIWILKSLYSMAYLETLWCVLLAPLGMVIGCRNRKTNVI